MNNVDVDREFAVTGEFCKAFSDGANNVRVKEGLPLITLNEWHS